MLWEVKTDEYAATVKVEGLEFLRLERDSYGVDGSDFITHNGHEGLSVEFHYAEDYDGNQLHEIDYDEHQIIEDIAAWHLKI